MSEFSLNPYSRKHALHQGRQLRSLVRDQAAWLPQERPGLLERYKRLPDAIKNVVRLAGDSALRAFLIERNGYPRGIATVITGQAVHHPQAGDIEGTDLDYWLVPNARREEHLFVARRLIAFQRQYAPESTPLATIPRYSAPEHVAQGIPRFLTLHDEIVHLEPVGADPYDISRHSEPVAFYVGVPQPRE